MIERNLVVRGVFAALCLAVAPAHAADVPAPCLRIKCAFLDARLGADARARDLLGRMTLAEKVRQLDMYSGLDDLTGANNDRAADPKTGVRPEGRFDPAMAEKALGRLGAGSIHDVYPSPQLYNAIQAWVIRSSRLGIPALFIEEGLHGYMTHGQTIFPQSVNLAATWNVDMAQQTGAAIAAEARANGVDMLLGPVLDVARDPRWGRVEEDFGEDPFLTGQLGLAYVRGMQGTSLASDHNVIAEPKHFAGHGSPESGLNTAPVHAGEREMRSVMLKSFEPAFREGGAMATMAAYHDIDGVPVTADPWLFNQVLRGEWGFKGFVLSDLGAIRRLYDTHHVADSPAAAVQLALRSGVDMQFYDFPHAVFQDALIDGVRSGKVAPATLDAAVLRILRAKFMLGLFDRPFVDEEHEAMVRRAPAHLALSLEVARQSITLLKNDGGLLPLRKDLKRIAVIGPNAELARLGDYVSATVPERADFGMLAQIRKLVSPQTRVDFANGDAVDQAVALAKDADVAILALGENAEVSGENHDRSELGLPGRQQALLEAVAATGKPIIIVLQNGRALTIPWAAEHVPAIIEAWYPGEYGGRAIAETLFGDVNPAGRLPVTFPRSVGQLPVFYNHFPAKDRDYGDGSGKPLFVFGYGLSFTSFKYTGLSVSAPAKGDLSVSFDLTNGGPRAGDEVAQLYVRQATASVATPEKALKGFVRVHLAPGETRRITIPLKRSELAIWGADRAWRVEPGDYKLTVGGSSAADLSATVALR
jgi:beta-glucosidase